MPPFKDRIGIKYNRLVVIGFVGIHWNNNTLWKCKCDCGNIVIIQGGHLQNGHTKSCGCFRREMLIKNTKENAHNYIDGKYCNQYRKLRERIRKRDNYICQECGKTQEQELKEVGRKLDVHHIDGNSSNNLEENLTTLCLSCHNKAKPR